MTEAVRVRAEFDADALMRELDAKRAGLGLRWMGVADALTAQSAELRARMQDHAVCGGALARTVQRRTMSCQYALMLLRWLGRAPEDFLTGDAVDVGDTGLPTAGPDRRLLWDVPALNAALAARRTELGLTWVALGSELGCAPNRLTSLRTARLADMHLVMRITQWLGVPAARFIDAVDR